MFPPSLATATAAKRLFSVFVLGLLFSPSASAQSQSNDLARLVHPEVAEELNLDDQQRAKIQTLLQQRTSLQAAEQTAETQQKSQNVEQQIRDLLTPEQLGKFQTSTPNQSLRFQFRAQAWADVLNWFARQENLTLVMDREPPGTFTYTDDRDYNSAEAIDLLNSVLLTRGYTLVRREKMLTLLQLGESIPIELIPRIKLEELTSRGKFELVSVLFPLGARPVDAVMGEIKNYLGTYGRAIPLPQSRQLLVVESAGKMETINVLIQSVPEPKQPAPPQPQPKPPEPVFAAYPLGELDPQVTLELIRGLVGSDRITVDSETRLLTAYVVPGQQQAIQAAIEQMRQSGTESPPQTSVAYAIEAANEEAISSQILALAPRAVVAFDAVGQRLLVTADPSDQARIKTALEELGISGDKTELVVRSYEVEAAQAVTLAAALQQMLPKSQTIGNATLGTVVVRGSEQDLALADEVYRRWTGKDGLSGKIVHPFQLDRQAPASWLATVAKIVPKAELWLDADGRRLLMLGSTDDRQTLETMLPQLLTAIPETPQPQLNTYPLSEEQFARWQELQPTLAADLADAKIISQPAADGRGAQLLVWATEKSQTRIQELLDQIQQNSTPTPDRRPRIHPLTVEESELVIEVISDRFPSLRLSTDPTGESVTTWADEETQNAIAELITSLQAELTPRSALEIKPYATGKLPASQLQALLQPVMTQQSSAGTITIDPSGARLLIWAEPKTHSRLAELVEQLDNPLPTSQAPVLLAYSLQHADAVNVKTLLDATLTGVTVVADGTRRQLIATGTLQQHGQIKSILAEIDQPESAAATPEIRTYTLQKLQAATLLPSLQSLYPNMKLSLDTVSNQIIASGTTFDHQSLRQAIDRLQETDEETETRVQTYTLAAGDLRTLPAVLAQLAPRAIVSADALNKALVVWGTDEDHKRIGEAIDQLSSATVDRQELVVFQVRPDQLTGLQTSIVSLFPGTSVAVEPASGRLTVLAAKTVVDQISDFVNKSLQAEAKAVKPVPQAYNIEKQLRTPFTTLLSATVPRATVVSTPIKPDDPTVILALPDDHARIDSLLATLGEQIKEDPSSEVRAYSLGRTDPTAFASLLAERRGSARIIGGAGTDRPVIADSSEGHQEIEILVKELETAFASTPNRLLRVLEIRKDLATAATAGLLTIAPKAILLPSSSPDRLTVLATDEELKQIQAWIADMGQTIEEPEQATSKVYPLDNADPTTTVRVLQSLLPTAVFAADPATGTVAATGTTEQHERIAEVVQQLNDAKSKSETLKAYRLKRVDAITVVAALQQAFGRRSTVGVSADSTGSTIFVLGNPDQQTIAEQLISEVDVDDPAANKVLRVFEVREDLSAGATIGVPSIAPKANVIPSPAKDRLAVLATPEDHQRIAAWLEKMQQDVAAPEPRQSIVYPLERADPVAAVRMLQSLLPTAIFAADTESQTVGATAMPEEHEQIAALIDQLNNTPSRTESLKAYVLRQANPETVVAALQQAFGRRSSAGVSADTKTATVFVVGRPEQQKIAADLIEQMDQQNPASQRDVKVFSTVGISGSDVADSLEDLLQDSRPKADIQFDYLNDRLIAVATPEQLTLIEHTLTQFQPIARELEIFPLRQSDPDSIRTAINSLFSDLSFNASPSITVDEDRGQLLIRATPDQLEEIRDLLARLGEGSPANDRLGANALRIPTRRVRTIIVGRRSEALLRQLQNAWPAIHPAPLRIIQTPQNPTALPTDNPPLKPAEPAAQPAAEEGAQLPEIKPIQNASGRLVSTITQNPVTQNLVPQNPDATESSENQSETAPQQEKQAPASIVIFPEGDRWTIASTDPEALETLANLIEATVTPIVSAAATSGNRSIYILQHADASELQGLLTTLFSERRSSSRTTGREDSTRIVADSRINALVVQGSLTDRNAIEELLTVLDSPEFIGVLTTDPAVMVPVRNTSAERIVELLNKLYAAQLAGDGGRPRITIPSGISDNVAELLQQINASTTGPLLTIGVDDVTNSIVLRAPRELADDVRSFIQQVDQESLTGRSNRLRIIPLHGTNSDQMFKAVELLRRLESAR